MNYAQLLAWINNVARTRGELQAAAVGLGLNQAGNVNALRRRIRDHIVAQDPFAPSPFTPAGWAAPTITATAPAGAVVWPIRSNQTITWNSVNVPAGNVNVEISRDGGAIYAPIGPNVPNTGAFNWVVTGPTTANARVRVSTVAAPVISGASAANFTVSTPAAGGPLVGNPLVRAIALVAAGALGSILGVALLFGIYAVATGNVPALPTRAAAAPTTTPAPTYIPVLPTVVVVAPTTAPATDKFGCPTAGGYADQAENTASPVRSPVVLQTGQVAVLWGSDVKVNGISQGKRAYYLVQASSYNASVGDGRIRIYTLAGSVNDFRQWARCFVEKGTSTTFVWDDLSPVAATSVTVPTPALVITSPIGDMRSVRKPDGTLYFQIKAHPRFDGSNFGAIEDGSDPMPEGTYEILPGQVGATWWDMITDGTYRKCVVKWIGPGKHTISGSGRIRVWSFTTFNVSEALYKAWWLAAVQKEAGATCTYTNE